MRTEMIKEILKARHERLFLKEEARETYDRLSTLEARRNKLITKETARTKYDRAVALRRVFNNWLFC